MSTKAVQEPQAVQPAKWIQLACVAALAVFSSGVGAAAQAKKKTGNVEAAYPYIMKAKAAAGEDLHREFYHRCFIDSNYAGSIARFRKTRTDIEPAQVFDNLYWINSGDNNVWILKTSEGIILFDSFNNPGMALELKVQKECIRARLVQDGQKVYE